jgi:uncharacterized protein
MVYNLAQLLIEPVGSFRDYDIDTSSIDPEEDPGSKLDWTRGWVRIIKTHQGLLVRARLEVQMNLACSRCIKEFKYQSVLTIEEEAFPTVNPGTGGKTDPPEEAEGAIHLDDHHVLDMKEVIRQYLLTDTPIKPLCSKECPGLCPECGINLNEENCECKATPMDPRWETLAELLTERQR